MGQDEPVQIITSADNVKAGTDCSGRFTGGSSSG
ncbi:hypothetical protein [Allisonella histaminiformans]